MSVGVLLPPWRVIFKLLLYTSIYVNKTEKHTYNHEKLLTLKNVWDDPLLLVPYSIFVCLAKSSALSISDTILSTVRKAARFAVYDDTRNQREEPPESAQDPGGESLRVDLRPLLHEASKRKPDTAEEVELVLHLVVVGVARVLVVPLIGAEPRQEKHR